MTRRLPTAALLAALVVAAALAPLLTSYDPNQTALLARLRPPVGLGGSWAHAIGTDQLGRDMLSRCLYGLRNSLGIALLGSCIGTVIGIAVGIAAGARPGRLDTALMLLVDVQLALPYLLIVLIGLAVFGTSITVLIPLISLAGWEHTARLVRGQLLALRRMSFVEAATASGASPLRVMLRHVLPHLLPLIAIQLTLAVPHVMLLESSLSFLGIGVQPPTATLGRMIGEGRQQMLAAWWIVAEPTLLILAVALALQGLTDSLGRTRDAATGILPKGSDA
jgi:peptide/nickel transport system permease protein